MNIGLVTASYVARVSEYAMQPFMWGKAERETREAFLGVDFERNFDALIATVAGAGYEAIELWNSHLPVESSAEHIRFAKRALKDYGVKLIAYYHSMSRNMSRDEIQSVFDMVEQLEVPLMIGVADDEVMETTASLCRTYGIRYGLENHGERTPKEYRQKINGYEDCCGLACDTGWWGTHNYPAQEAITELLDALIHVHLKDVLAIGGHDTCALGDGVVDVRSVVRTLMDTPFQGYICVEHEPEHFDPTADLSLSLQRLQNWL